MQYFDRFCDEFDAGEENKLSYTTIHNEYQQMVEREVRSALGAEKYKLLCNGLEGQLKSGKHLLGGSEKTRTALEVLRTRAGDRQKR